MVDPRYDFKTINVVKMLVRNSKNEVLIIKEPATNKWMPLHWGLPGGKPLLKESLLETFERKSVGDIGQNINLKGIVSIKELLMDNRTVLMFILLAEASSNEVAGEGAEYKWVSKKEVANMGVNDFTEFFNKDLLLTYFSEDFVLTPYSIIETHDFYNLENDPDYKSWLKSGSPVN